MFTHTNDIDPRISHARLGKQIIDSQAAEPNLTVEFEEGFLNRDGEFVSMGANHITFIGEEFFEAIMVAKDAIGPGYTEKCEAWLAAKLEAARVAAVAP